MRRCGVSEHTHPAHANGDPYACAARGDTHNRPAYLYAASALSDRDTNPTTYRNTHGDGNAYPVSSCDTDARPACYRYGLRRTTCVKELQTTAGHAFERVRTTSRQASVAARGGA